MNFQQHRNLPSFTSLPQFHTSYHPNQHHSNNGQSQHQIERQSPVRNNAVKLPFNLKEYSFEMKEYLHPQKGTLNAPLTFNLQTPTKLKAKKSSQLLSNSSNKKFANHQYSRQLQAEFFKNDQNPLTSTLEDFSKTTSTINAHSILNMQQNLRETHVDELTNHLKSRQEIEGGKVVHSNSVKVLFQRETENKYASSTVNQSNGAYFQRKVEPSTSKSRQNAYILDQRFLLEEIKVLKERNENYQKEITKINENYQKQIGRLNIQIKALKSGEKKEELRGSRKENSFQTKQLQLQYEQNAKLLRQIEQMEKDLRGKVELNKFLEHQCNVYNQKCDKLKLQFDNYKDFQIQQKNRKQQNINLLQKQIYDYQNQINTLKLADITSKEQIVHLKKSLQLQGEKMEEMYTNSQIFKSEINLLSKKLQNLQMKYQKLMHSHCEAELKLHHFEESKKQQLAEQQVKQQSLMERLRQMEIQLNKVSEEKQDLYMQFSTNRGQLIQANTKISQIKQYYQRQYSTICQQLTQTNKIAKQKQQECIKVQERQSQLKQKQNKMFQQLQQKTSLLSSYTSQLDSIKAESQNIEVRYKDIHQKYQSLKNNYQSQSARYKQLQKKLIQHESEYKMMQRDFAGHQLKWNTVQSQYDNLKQLYKGLQSLHNQSITQQRNEKDSLEAKNAELLYKIQSIYSQYNQFKKVHEQFQRQTLNTQLAQSSKSEVQTWQLVSKKQVQIQALQAKIVQLEQALQQEMNKFTRQGLQTQRNQQSMKEQIVSLMLIMSENENRNKVQKDQLQEKISELNEKIILITQKHIQEQAYYQNIIVELKQSIQKLQRQEQGEQLNTSKSQILQQQVIIKKWSSFNQINQLQSIDSFSQQRKIQSASQLCLDPSEIDYIQMDRAGITYLCELLHIEIGSGNILNQIVVKVENNLNEVILSRKIQESYRQVLHAFGVQESSGSFANLMQEINSFKEGLGMVIEQLNQEQGKVQALRAECIGQRLAREAQHLKGERMVHEISVLVQLNRDLNDTITTLTAKLCNSKMKMFQAIFIAKLSIPETSIRSEKFFTVKSIGSSGQSTPIFQSFGQHLQ